MGVEERDLRDVLGVLTGAEQVEGVGEHRSRVLGVQLAETGAGRSFIAHWSHVSSQS